MAVKNAHKIPPLGSLALLGYGAEGVRAWRKARQQHLENIQSGNEKS